MGLYYEAGSHPTCVISGKDRHHTWLYAHDRTPMVLRRRRTGPRLPLAARHRAVPLARAYLTSTRYPNQPAVKDFHDHYAAQAVQARFA